MIWVAIFSGILIVQYVLLVFFLKMNWKNHARKKSLLPKVSVLVAARNEEVHILNLLQSLSDLDYPPELLQVLLADDQSEDRTAQIIREWVQNEGNRTLVSIGSIEGTKNPTNGKANALAILGHQATGDYFFFTDADCEVPATWIREGVKCFEGGTGLVIGITQVRSRGFFEQMQEIDWWNTLGLVKVVTDLEMPTTGLGNNMVISRAAYEECGGFDQIPFSLTEDLEISKSIHKQGYKIRHQVSEDFLVRTKPENGLKSLLKQRKRWMAGAMTLSIPWKILLSLQVLFYPAILILIALDWQVGVFIWCIKALVQSVFLQFFLKKAGQSKGVLVLILFEFYQIWNLSLTILYYFWPGKIEWKARKYP
ncbi:glycosyltransferase [Algoriphagus litoralis]|uniref:glycosyltransferase n=1 Tax=Algoriphagus litoralis TaxID=2202829 RepID=UPI000DB908AE|nr:glycosyltransferase [Algoriphagus litoralis]